MTTQTSPSQRDTLKQQVASLRWFHAIDFGDFQSCGRYPDGEPPNQTLYTVFDLLSQIDISNARCLDVGTAHGLTAFGLKTRGAPEVVACDVGNGKSRAFSLAQELLELDVSYKAGVAAGRLTEHFGKASFDLVVCAGVMYHLLSPFDAISQPRQILKPGGLLVLETAVARHVKESAILFNAAEQSVLPEPYTYFVPSRTAIEDMLRLACFEILAVRPVRDRPRIAYLARASTPEELTGRSDMCRKVHELGCRDPQLPLDEILASSAPSARVSVSDSLQAESEIDVNTFKPNFPPHPKHMADAVGISVGVSR